MGNLVDARLPLLLGVTNANRDQNENRPPVLFFPHESGSPLASGSWQVELDTAGEAGSVLSFRFAAPQPLVGHAVT